jgi:cardiolipin synthase
VDAPQAFPQIYRAIAAAKRSVDVSMFSIRDNGSGAQLAQLLKRKAAEGVEVNVQIDDIGSYQWKPADYEFVNSLRAAGVHVVRNSYKGPFGHNRVDHRKLYVIDGTTAFVGGMNLSSTYDTWHDVMVRMSGPVVAQAGALFVQQFEHNGGHVSAAQKLQLARPLPAAGSERAQLVENMPGVSERNTQSYLSMINGAHHRIWVSTPYIGDPQLAAALVAAARRGVDVRIATTSPKVRSLVPGMQDLTRSYYGELTDAGAQIYEEPRMAHAKMLIADGQTSVGSMNLSHTSAAHDVELNVVTSSPQFQRQVAAVFRHDFASSHRVTHKDAHSRTDDILADIRRWLHIRH